MKEQLRSIRKAVPLPSTTVLKHSLVTRIGAFRANHIIWFAAGSPGNSHLYRRLTTKSSSSRLSAGLSVNDLHWM
jgi:hypothetical protein